MKGSRQMENRTPEQARELLYTKKTAYERRSAEAVDEAYAY